MLTQGVSADLRWSPLGAESCDALLWGFLSLLREGAPWRMAALCVSVCTHVSGVFKQAVKGEPRRMKHLKGLFEPAKSWWKQQRTNWFRCLSLRSQAALPSLCGRGNGGPPATDSERGWLGKCSGQGESAFPSRQ